MLIKVIALIGLSVMVSLPAARAAQMSALSFSLTYLDRFKIKDEEAGLTEPSGLVLARDDDALWTISDDNERLFKLDLEGELLSDQSFKIDDEGLEGVTVDPITGDLLVIKEEAYEILKIDTTSKKTASRHLLSDMAGFEIIGQHLSGDADNNGLEGITFNQDTETFFLLKEREPGLIIEISKDLESILGMRVLDAINGFADDDVDADEIDFSGLQYDPARSSFWIVSDRAKRLFLYDWEHDQVIQSATLGYEKDGKFREIEKAEGIAIDARSHRLYVVSDAEARLYVFDFR
ncbi:MAG: SdiA-regulated domain-containing protein [Geminicoccaceae bacterium]